MKSLSERLQSFIIKDIIEEEDYQISLPFSGQKANDIVNSLGVSIQSDDDAPDLKGRVYNIRSTPKSGDAITIRQKLDATMKKNNLDPKLAVLKVTKL